jgi:predicted cobalt transporter CbtA
MLAIDRSRRLITALPAVVRVGLLVLAFGGLADVVAHVEAIDHPADGHDHGAAEVTAHLTVFVGMALIQTGVVVDGVRRSLAAPHRADGPDQGVA